ncbi:hypothetical protein OHA98_04145 [Streptomyces sp. NBC_00654]|uniref:hypothetical protein n=1 Tax=Streptomyces sp. NBC_00654 TaxID=2975799 RepID=UPI0022598E7D|nr:hypothetical protein [Streptomyces sp. NBC_00654]MCX4964023.1 hypothetical protein [Streptomyces sp. NBC_00654]
MLRHVIAPSSGYTKASNNVVRTRRMSSDAKILLLYVQGLPESARNRPLSELANRLDMTGRSYQRAKRQLIENGFVHEWRSQVEGGRWTTEQLFTNIPLTSAEAAALREGPSTSSPPSEQSPTVGRPTPRQAGGYQPVEDDRDMTTPHPPSEAPAAEPPAAPGGTGDMFRAHQLQRAEGVLLSLRHSRRELHLGVREARSLAVEAVKWLERGLSTGDLRHAMLAERPEGGVRSAVGFLRYRLAQKLPEAPGGRETAGSGGAAGWGSGPAVTPRHPAAPPVRELMTCAGPGEEHVFRPAGDETECADCRQAAAWEAWQASASAYPEHPDTPEYPEDATWRERFAIARGHKVKRQ